MTGLTERTSLAVAGTSIGALSRPVRNIVGEWGISPGELIRAGAEGAVRAQERGHNVAFAVHCAIFTAEAGALVPGCASTAAQQLKV